MNELPVVGSFCLRTDFWNRHGKTLQLTRRKCMANGCSDVQKTILLRDFRFFAALLSEMDLGNADTTKA